MSNTGSNSADFPTIREMTPEELRLSQQIPSQLTPYQQILWQQLSDYQRSELVSQYYDSATGAVSDGQAFVQALLQMTRGVTPEPYVPDGALGVMEHIDNAQGWVASEQAQLLQEAGSAEQVSSNGVITSGTQYYSSDGGRTWRLLPTNWPWSPWTRLGPLAGLGLFGIIAAAILSLVLSITRACSADFVNGDSLNHQQQNGARSTGAGGGGSPVSDSPTKERYVVHETDSTPRPDMPAGAADSGWEARLQKERLIAIVRGDMASYNQLVRKDLEIYQLYGVNPCESSYFKEGCQH